MLGESVHGDGPGPLRVGGPEPVPRHVGFGTGAPADPVGHDEVVAPGVEERVAAAGARADQDRVVQAPRLPPGARVGGPVGGGGGRRRRCEDRACS